MNCQKVQQELATERMERWSSGTQSHVEACAECRSFAARQRRLTGLLAIARHEAPDAHHETRLLAHVRAEFSRPPAFGWARLSWRYGLAAAALAVAVLPWMNRAPAPADGPSGLPTLTAASTEPFSPAIPSLRLQEFAAQDTRWYAATNTPDRLGPQPIRYGAGDSMTVDFRY